MHFFRLFFVGIFCWLSGQWSFSQQVQITGSITNNKGEKVPYVNVIESLNQVGTLSDSNGTFSLKVRKGSAKLIFQFVGFKSDTLKFTIQNDTVISRTLDAAENLNEVVVQGDYPLNALNQKQLGMISIKASEAKQLPQILGEANIIQVLQMKPGIQSASEGGSGFYVRGGSPGQNMIMLDDAIIYNPNHLLGFFSLLNSDVIHSADIYKGGFPAQYGGRLSSVLNIKSKDPSTSKLQSSGGVGIVGSRAMVELPIAKGKSALSIAARYSYFNLITNQINNAQKNNLKVKPIPDYSFYDVNVKNIIHLSSKDVLRVGLYLGKDKLMFNQDFYNFNLNWQNLVANAVWIRQVSKQFSIKNTLSYSGYRYNLTNVIDILKVTVNSSISSVTAKSEAAMYRDSTHNIGVGIATTAYWLQVGNYQAGYTDGRVLASSGTAMRGWETSIYASDDIEINNKFSLMLGLRYSTFLNNNKFYHQLEPRFGAQYSLHKNAVLKFSYARMSQYLHLVTSSATTLPTDMWRLANKDLKPQFANQLNLGIDHRIFKTFYFGWSIYYKKYDNQIDLNNTTELLINTNIDKEFVYGKGWTYGSEFMVEKKRGNLTGWVSYTLGWSWLQFAEINDGVKYPSRYDRRHDVSVALSYKLSKRISLSCTWVFGTGNAITLPVSRFAVQDVIGSPYKVVPQYLPRNSFRMPNFHRMDVGLTWKFAHKKFDSELVFSVYNVYNRKNTYFIYFAPQKNDEGDIIKFVASKVSLFPFIPSISYNYKF